LEDIGFADAVIARETDDGLELIDGHLRQEVMGDQVVPVLIVDVTEEEADKMLLTYDPLAMMAHADTDQLLHLLRDTQFESKAVNDMLEAVANGERLPMPDLTEPVEDPGPQIDRADELREKWQTERGQVWEVGRHRLMCGDAREQVDIETLLLLERPALMMTDPPYGLNKRMAGGTWGLAYRHSDMDEWDYVVPQETLDNLQSYTSNAIIWGGNHYYMKPSRCWLIWKKPYLPTLSDVELAWTTFDKPSKCYENSRQPFDGHPTSKPLGLLVWCLTNYATGDIFDPFLGSGTTMVAAEQLGRICYGMEIEPKYVAVALERMAGMGLEPKLVTG
jgi:hypothetical protein